ncbi:hypothetical protein [Sphingomonas sp. URHD0057]|uniref:hypothetical protein n=1 Tax=Sphingomonas sp. URHD0057 TaxID=1380389 RepID=UPI00048F18CA|nr:hypothetical protein [Sphingomonas sp. URHD0057]
MTAAVLRLTPRTVTKDDVLRAYAVHRAMILAEVDDPRLLDDPAHQAAKEEAREKYLTAYNDWVRQ